MIRLIRYAEKFQTQCQLKKTQRYFDRIQPSARFGQPFYPFRKNSEEGERDRKCQGIEKHGEHGFDNFAAGSKEQNAPDNGNRAAKGDEHQRRCHEEYSDQTAFFRLTIDLVHQLIRRIDLKQTKEGKSKNNEDDEHKQIGCPMRSQCIQAIGSEQHSKQRSRSGINYNNRQSENDCLFDAFTPGLIILQKEGNGHGNHRKNTRRNQRSQAHHKSKQQIPQQGRMLIR